MQSKFTLFEKVDPQLKQFVEPSEPNFQEIRSYAEKFLTRYHLRLNNFLKMEKGLENDKNSHDQKMKGINQKYLTVESNTKNMYPQ